MIHRCKRLPHLVIVGYIWSYLRLTAKGHLKLSYFLQSWWAVVYWHPQQVYQVWSKSGEN